MKRLKGYCQPQIVELKESRLPANPSPADEENVRINEGHGILEKIEKSDYVITLEIHGKKLDSVSLSEKLEDIMASSSTIDFVIGGSLGLSEDVSRRADFKLSFSDMTFPHQLMRVILLEQIYRGFKIMRHEPYHK